MNAPHPPPPGWYPDPAGRAPFRYWDGTRWTEHTQQGVAPSPAPGAPGLGAPPAGAVPPPPAGYGGVAPVRAPGAAPAGGPLNAQSFLEELKRFDGWAIVAAAAALFVLCTFLPWLSVEATLAETTSDSVNAWSSDNAWLIRGWDATDDNIVNGDTSDSGTDAVLMVPLAIAAAGIAVAIRLGKPITRGHEILLGVSGVLAVLVMAEAVHTNGVLGDITRVYRENGARFDGNLSIGFYAGILMALLMVAGAFRSFQASRTVGAAGGR